MTGLVERLREVLERRPELLEGYLFGSQARREATSHSDVDVAVYVDPAFLATVDAPFGCFGYDAELTTVLMGALRRNDVDVVLLNAAPPLLYHRVLRDGVRLFARNLQVTTVREGRALSRWCDYVPQLAKIDRATRTAMERRR